MYHLLELKISSLIGQTAFFECNKSHLLQHIKKVYISLSAANPAQNWLLITTQGLMVLYFQAIDDP